MNMLLVIRARCWVAGTAMAALSVSVASAQFPPITIDGIYQQSTIARTTTPPTATSCDGQVQCYFMFSRVPNGKQLIVTNVSCSITLSGGTSIVRAVLLPQNLSGVLLDHLQSLHPGRTTGASFALNNTTLVPFNARQRPLIFFSFSGATVLSGHCAIAGRIIDAP